MTFANVGIGLVVLAAVWRLGGVALRVAGPVMIAAGVVGLAVGADPIVAAAVVAVGFLLWLLGQWHYALRKFEYKSPLARHLFCRWAPAWLDPTRGQTVADEPRTGERACKR